MIAPLVSGNQVIARIENDLSIDNSNWLTKAPLWIADALAEMNLVQAFELNRIELDIIDYQVLLPLNIKLLDRITINGVVLTEHVALNPKQKPDISNIHNHLKYAINNAYAVFGIETGKAVFYYRVPSVAVANDYGIVVPNVPDNIFVFQAIKWYILVKLLQDGYVHPIFNLRENNIYTNPGLAWDVTMKKAKNSVGTLSYAERENVSKLLREFIVNYSYYTNEGFITNG